MSGSSNLDSFRDAWPYSCCFVGVLTQGLVQYCSQHSYVIAKSLFSIHLVSVLVVHPCSSLDTLGKNSVLFYRSLLTSILPRVYQ